MASLGQTKSGDSDRSSCGPGHARSPQGPARSTTRFAIEPLRPTRNQANSPCRAPSAPRRPSRAISPRLDCPRGPDTALGADFDHGLHWRRHGQARGPAALLDPPLVTEPVAATSDIGRRLQEPHVSDRGRARHSNSTSTSRAEPAPAGGWPVIVAIHGGGWRRFNKQEYGPRVASAFVPNGYVVVAPNYLLSARNRPSWPINFQDVQSAVLWVKANASRYGIDPTRVVAMGESAGANLANLLGTESGAAPAASGRGAVGVGPGGRQLLRPDRSGGPQGRESPGGPGRRPVPGRDSPRPFPSSTRPPRRSTQVRPAIRRRRS